MNREIAEKIKELAASGLEGLEYICQSETRCCLGQRMVVFSDVVQAFGEIESILASDEQELGSGLQQTMDDLHKSFAVQVEAYEQNKHGNPVQQETMLQRYKVWLEALDSVLAPYLAH